MAAYTLLIDTADEKGLVYRVTKVLYENELNIETQSEFVDNDRGRFFLRTRFVGVVDAESIRRQVAAVLPGPANVRVTTGDKKRIAILATREVHCLGDLLVRAVEGELAAEVAGVIGNHDAIGTFVRRFDLPFACVSHEGISREAHEAAVAGAIDALGPLDVIVLAKYMRILSPGFVARYPGRMINIHHSFLPAFVGANPYKQAYARGVKIIGATAHYVTESLDEGPIIEQDVVHIDHSYSWREMQRAGRDVEKVVLSRALNLVLEDRVFIYDNRTVVL